MPHKKVRNLWRTRFQALALVMALASPFPLYYALQWGDTSLVVFCLGGIAAAMLIAAWSR